MIYLIDTSPATVVHLADGAALASVRLLAASPNPFNPSTRIPFELPAEMRVRLVVHDIHGRRVRTLVDGELSAGEHVVRWDGRDATGRGVGSGAYFLRLETGTQVETGRLVLVR
jgi:hypothetical protein